jgi:hypothetical protein
LATVAGVQEREKTMQIPPVNYPGPHSEYDREAVEAREQKLERDFTGVPLPKGYWVSWIILVVLVVGGLVLLGVLHLI